MTQTLEIGALVMPTEAVLQFTQKYTDVVQRSFKRTASNRGIIRETGAKKLRTVISGKGFVPSGVRTIATLTTHEIKCMTPEVYSSDSTSITLPAARRTDAGHQPVGMALVGNRLVVTTISNLAALNSLASHVAELDPVAGAIGYRVDAWPQITAAVLVNDATDNGDGTYSWQFEAEEV